MSPLPRELKSRKQIGCTQAPSTIESSEELSTLALAKGPAYGSEVAKPMCLQSSHLGQSKGVLRFVSF